MKKSVKRSNVKRFSRATLAAIGLKVSSSKLLEAIKQNVDILQKSIRRTPFQKLTAAFIAILAGDDIPS